MKPWARYVHEPDERGIGTVKYPRIVPKDEGCAKRLKKRTLTNLYNERPTCVHQDQDPMESRIIEPRIAPVRHSPPQVRHWTNE